MRRVIVLAALAALALPTAASAKEVAALTLCGTDGCQKITAHAALRGFINGGYETLAPKQAGPFFSVKVAMRHAGDDAGGWTVEYLRAANLIRSTGEFSKHVWTRPAGATDRRIPTTVGGSGSRFAVERGLVDAEAERRCQVTHGSERTRRGERVTPGSQHDRSVGDPAAELVGERRLAHSGLAAKEHQTPVPRGSLAKMLLKLLQVRFPLE